MNMNQQNINSIYIYIYAFTLSFPSFPRPTHHNSHYTRKHVLFADGRLAKLNSLCLIYSHHETQTKNVIMLICATALGLCYLCLAYSLFPQNATNIIRRHICRTITCIYDSLYLTWRSHWVNNGPPFRVNETQYTTVRLCASKKAPHHNLHPSCNEDFLPGWLIRSTLHQHRSEHSQILQRRMEHTRLRDGADEYVVYCV